MNFFKSLSRRENARTVGRRTRSARVGVEAMESKLLLSTAAAPTYSLYSNGQLYEQTAGRSVLLASNVKAAAVTSTDAVIYLEQNGTLIEQPTSGMPRSSIDSSARSNSDPPIKSTSSTGSTAISPTPGSATCAGRLHPR